ncbi:MAG: hypothetical protein NT088_01570, partial [Candidatus Omnitrophica bacterium]|nr:hypothetical protein [Candidatus Omnitrophota bacterium]
MKDRIYCSLLGASYNNEVLSVRQFTKWLILRGRDKKTDFEITLKDAQIVSLEHASTKYLKIKNINILYGFPDLLTLKDFQSWVVENRKQKLDTVCL